MSNKEDKAKKCDEGLCPFAKTGCYSRSIIEAKMTPEEISEKYGSTDWDEIKYQMFASSYNSHSSTNITDNIAASNTSNNKIVPLKLLKADASNYIEKRLISYVLHQKGGNKTKAAKALEISYKALLYKMQNLGLR